MAVTTPASIRDRVARERQATVSIDEVGGLIESGVGRDRQPDQPASRLIRPGQGAHARSVARIGTEQFDRTGTMPRLATRAGMEASHSGPPSPSTTA